MKTLHCFLLSILLGGITATASAQQNGGGGGAGMGERFFPAIGRVLTDDQRQSLRQIVIAERAQLQPLERQLRTSRQALLDEITGGTNDEVVLRQDADQYAKAEADLTVMFAKALSQMEPPLSAGQIQQLKNYQGARLQDVPDDPSATPPSHLKLPPQLPHDTNDLPMVQ
jgi:Spy/CpxP family protein refolding chaperone